MESETEKTPQSPEAAIADYGQRYGDLCAQIGERKYLAVRLEVEIQLLMKELDKLAPRQPAQAAAPTK